MTERTAPVSAVMPAYNAEPYIRESIESVLAQTRPVAELIVVSDGSTDRTEEIAESMGAQVFRQRSLGPSAARNQGILKSSQPWIAFIDSDDIWEPEKIARQMELVEDHPDLALVTCDYSTFDQSAIISASALDKYRAGYEVQPKQAGQRGAIIDCLDPGFADAYYLMLPSFAMVRRDVLEMTGQFDESLKVGEDFDCFMRLLASHKFGIVETVLGRRREHKTNLSQGLGAALNCLAATSKVLEDPHRYPAATVKLCEQWLPSNLRHAGARLLCKGDATAARALLLQSASLEFSFRTILALVFSFSPPGIGRKLMEARYYLSREVGI